MARASIQTDLSLDTTRFQRGLAKSQKSIKSFVSSGVKQFGALAGAAGLGAMAKAAIDLGSKISDMAVQLNIGATELQVLEFAAREAGVEVSVMERALRNVQLRTQEAINGNKSYGEAFRRLGIDINTFNKLPTEKKLEAVAVAQRNATDQTAAYNDVAIILGQRAGPAMQEVLQNLAGPKGYGGLEAAAKRANEVMSDEAIAKMDKAADTIESFKRKLTVLSAEVLSDFTDGLKIMGGWLDKIRGKMEAFDEFEEMAQQSLMARGEFEKFGILDKKIFGFQSQRSKEKQARNMAKLKVRADELREAFKKLSKEEQAVAKGELFQEIKGNVGSKNDKSVKAIVEKEESRKKKIEEVRDSIEPDLVKEAEDGRIAGEAYSTAYFEEFEEQAKRTKSEVLRADLKGVGKERKQARRFGDWGKDKELRQQESDLRRDISKTRDAERAARLRARLGGTSDQGGAGAMPANGARNLAGADFQTKSIELQTNIKDLMEPISKHYVENSNDSLQRDSYKSQIDLYKLAETQSEDIKQIVTRLDRLDQALR